MAGGPSGRKEGKGKRGNDRGFEWGIIALIGVLAGKRKEGEKARARRIPRGYGGGRRAGGRRKGRGRREADRWDPGVSDSKRKRKREREVGRRGVMADGTLGRLG
jgi:hypothetical protein